MKNGKEIMNNEKPQTDISGQFGAGVIPLADGCINTDSDSGKLLGFTSDLFEGYLWKKDKDIYVSFIISKKQGKGNLRRLFDNILKAGYNIKVPTPFPRMEKILRKLGFKPTFESDENYCDGESVVVWLKQAI